MVKSALSVALTLLVLAAPWPRLDASQTADGFDVQDVLKRMRAAYLALNTYSDTGTVVDDVGAFEDRSQFRTFYTRDPRNLLIDFRGIECMYKNGFRIPYTNRVVFWMQAGELQKWDQTGAHETYPSDGGGQVDALKSASYGSAGITILFPSLAYPKANLATPIQAMEEPVAAGFESIGGRRSFKITGIERWRFPNGRITGVRPVTLWLDAETYLLRKMLQDTPKGSAVGRIDRRIITLEPAANPKLEPSVFQFKVPSK